MADLEFIGIKEVFPAAYESGSLEVVTEIETEMSNLVSEKIITEERTFVYIVKRRGSNLFHPFLETIIDRHFVGSIRVFKDITQLKQDNKCGESCIVLTDAIREGNEITRIIRELNKKNIKVLKVCGYLAQIGTLNRLREDFTGTTFEFVHSVKDYKTYQEYLAKLSLIHLLRIEPLDSEHPYITYEIYPKITEYNLKMIIQQLCPTAYFGEYDERCYPTSHIIRYSVIFEEINVFNCLQNIKPNDTILFPELKIRFNFNVSKSLLRIMPVCLVYLDLIKHHNCNCDFVNIINRMEKYCSLFQKNTCVSKEMMCPLCLDINLSLSVMNEIDGMIQKKIKFICENSRLDNYKMNKVREYNPFRNF
jgi:hypothetical protein